MHNVQLQRGCAKSLKACCLWHEERGPSMYVYADGVYCYGCHVEKVDVFALWQQLTGCDFPTAKRELAAMAGVELQRYSSPGAYSRPVSRPAPVPRPQPAPLPPDGLEVHSALWEAVQRCVPTQAARRWLASRGLQGHAAWTAGARDWSAAADEVLAVLTSTPMDRQKAARIVKDDGSAWGVLRGCLKGQPWAQGLTLPLWHPEYGVCGWRWRVYQPELQSWLDQEDDNSAKVKVFGQPGSGVLYVPLGLREATGLARAGEAYSVVICEGEPDWLSVLDVAHELPGRVTAIGLTSMGKGWPAEHTGLLAGARRVVVAVHHGKGGKGAPAGEAVADEIMDGLVDALGLDEAARIWRSRTIRETDKLDLNDMHKAGRLTAFLTPLLEGAT
jgi:hypothetical protein